MLTKEQVRNYWDVKPCEVDGRSLVQIEDERVASREFMDATKYYKKKVLEVGIGSGVDFIQWCRAGCNAHGVDLTLAAVEHTRMWLSKENLEGYVEQADAENLPIADEQFDLVYSWGVLHHTPNTLKAIQECVRVCKTGGELKFMLYNKYSLTWLLACLLKTFVGKQLESPGTKAFSKKEIKRMLLGCEITEIRSRTCRYDTFWRLPWYVRVIAWTYNYLTNNEHGWFVTIKAVKEVE